MIFNMKLKERSIANLTMTHAPVLTNKKALAKMTG